MPKTLPSIRVILFQNGTIRVIYFVNVLTIFTIVGLGFHVVLSFLPRLIPILLSAFSNRVAHYMKRFEPLIAVVLANVMGEPIFR